MPDHNAVPKLQIPVATSGWRRWRFIIFSLATALVLLTLMSWSWQQLQKQNPDLALATVEQGEVMAAVSGYGSLLPRQNRSLIAEVDGTVTELLLFPGSQVQQGSAIIQLRNPQLERERERAALALLEAQAAKESLQATQQREAIALENEIAIVRSDIALAEQEMQTLKVLLEQQILARLEYLRADTKLSQVRMRLAVALRNQTALAQAQAADIRAADYRLQQAAKMLAIAEYDIAQLTIRADRDGLLTVLTEGIDVGKPLRKGDLVAQITDPRSLYADIRVPANEAARLQQGQAASVTVRGQTITAEVLRIYPTAEQNQVRVELQLLGTQPDHLRPNMDVAALITTERRNLVTRVKTPLYITNAGQQAVFIARGEQFVRREVDIGVIGRDFIEVRTGLNQGEQILLDVPASLLPREQFAQGDIHGQ